MKRTYLILSCLVGLCLGGCRLSDIKTLTVAVPGMVTAEDADKITHALGTIGITPDKVDVDMKGRKLVVTYESLNLGHKNIEIAIVEAGYEANGIQPVVHGKHPIPVPAASAQSQPVTVKTAMPPSAAPAKK